AGTPGTEPFEQRLRLGRQLRRRGTLRGRAARGLRSVRDIPLPDSLGARLAEHIRLHPPVKVTLPWQTPDGEPVSHRLLLSKPNGNALDRNTFRQRVWRPALIEAGMEMGRYINGCHTLRHTAASAWLAAGIDIATVAGYLGDSLHT